MKRFHLHLSVDDLEQNIGFYSGIFGQPPTVRKDDYAKWMIEDPRINFALSRRGRKTGLDHMGIQAEDKGELDELQNRFRLAGMPVLDQKETSCCYSRSDRVVAFIPEAPARTRSRKTASRDSCASASKRETALWSFIVSYYWKHETLSSCRAGQEKNTES